MLELREKKKKKKTFIVVSKNALTVEAFTLQLAFDQADTRKFLSYRLMSLELPSGISL